MESGYLCYQAQTLADLQWRWKRFAARLLLERDALSAVKVRCMSASAGVFDVYLRWALELEPNACPELDALVREHYKGHEGLLRRWRALAAELQCNRQRTYRHFCEHLRAAVLDVAVQRLETGTRQAPLPKTRLRL